MLENNIADSLSKDYINKIRNLVDGNNLSSEDVVDDGYFVDYATVKQEVIWTFSTYYSDNRIARGQALGINFNNNYNDFENHSKNIFNLANEDSRYKDWFLNYLISKDSLGILEADCSEKYIYNFDAFSYIEYCTVCSGNGTYICDNCHGTCRATCQNCYATGSVKNKFSVTRNGQPAGYEWRNETCKKCYGVGKTTCKSCSGQGREVCIGCSGEGWFTTTRYISIVAQPSLSMTVYGNLQSQALVNYLSGLPLNHLLSYINFSLEDNHAVNMNQHALTYTGTTLTINHNFSILNYQYSSYSFTNPPIEYIKPLFFDFLLKDISNYHNIISNTPSNQQEALTQKLYKELESIRIFRELKDIIIIERTKPNYNHSYIILQKCENYISQAAADNLSSSINVVLENLVPSRKKGLWSVTYIAAIIIPFWYGFKTSFTLSEVGWGLAKVFILSLIFIATISAIDENITRKNIKHLLTDQSLEENFSLSYDYGELVAKAMFSFAIAVVIRFSWSMLIDFTSMI